jgi:hypothetical protein
MQRREVVQVCVVTVILTALLSTGSSVVWGQSCDPAPLPGCRQPTVENKALLLLKSKGGGGEKDKLVWKWLKGDATALEDLGDPINATTYTLCIYDEAAGVPSLALTAAVLPGGTCDGDPCWSAIGKGFKYKDSTATSGGIKNILLKFGESGKAKIVVKGTGASLDMPALPFVQDPTVVVQLKNNIGVCWEARYSAPATDNSDAGFKDKGDAALPTSTPVATASPTVTATTTVTATATITNTPASTGTATNTGASTATRTATATSSRTSTATLTPTATNTSMGAPPTSTATATRTATATPTTGTTCGNGILEPGETCTSCAADCTILTCTSPGVPLQTFRINFTAPLGTLPTVASSLVGYRSNRVSLPGSGSTPAARVKNRPTGTSQLVNDLNYAVRVLIQANAGATIPNGRLYTIDFDTCMGASPVTPADFACQIESCAGAGGPIDGCSCVVTTAP